MNPGRAPREPLAPAPPAAGDANDGRALPFTALLRAWQRGDLSAFDQLGPLLYSELRRLATFHLRAERPGHTLAPTDLISEVYLRLSGGAPLEFNDRRHFFALASRSMRQILVDHARRRSAEKRGAGTCQLTLRAHHAQEGPPWRLLELHEALLALAELDERKARAVELHYFGGLTQEEIAATCEVHVNTVARDLRFSEAWLRAQLQDAVSEAP